MTDIFSKEKRSLVMSKIKSKDTEIEHFVKKSLKKYKIKFNDHPFNFEGKPDYVIPSIKTVIFVDSCFWHGCRYHGSIPKSNKNFWQKKISRNKKRDLKITKLYKSKGWKIIRLWEHVLTKKDKMHDIFSKLSNSHKNVIIG